MRRLIVNADDFGFSPVVNAAVLKAHREGILTSASLMVAEEGFEEAVEIARRTPSLGVGLHLVAIGDRAVLPSSEIPLIAGAEGRFGSDPLRVGLRYAFSKTAQKQLRNELACQFERFAETGLEWSHVDGHQHYHLHPFVWDTLLTLCDTFGVHRLRMPHEPLRAHLRDGYKPDFNTFALLALRAMRRRNLRVLKEKKTLAGKTPFLSDRVYGLLRTGTMTADYVQNLLRRIESDVTEVYFHPGTQHALALPLDQQSEDVRDVELAALLDSDVREQVRSRDFQLGTYAEAEKGQKSLLAG